MKIGAFLLHSLQQIDQQKGIFSWGTCAFLLSVHTICSFYNEWFSWQSVLGQWIGCSFLLLGCAIPFVVFFCQLFSEEKSLSLKSISPFLKQCQKSLPLMCLFWGLSVAFTLSFAVLYLFASLPGVGSFFALLCAPLYFFQVVSFFSLFVVALFALFCLALSFAQMPRFSWHGLKNSLNSQKKLLFEKFFPFFWVISFSFFSLWVSYLAYTHVFSVFLDTKTFASFFLFRLLLIAPLSFFLAPSFYLFCSFSYQCTKLYTQDLA